ncbi:unnamed protein product [Dovyalis caffra]|uniref:Uncharacterized protein n=1 Tax=Dovyalis caffra TaxID=77055 RepID=A0AAV1SBG8_9ROSI|nr:unnamed protein product [Dovyalis caffra]
MKIRERGRESERVRLISQFNRFIPTKSKPDRERETGLRFMIKGGGFSRDCGSVGYRGGARSKGGDGYSRGGGGYGGGGGGRYVGGGYGSGRDRGMVMVDLDCARTDCAVLIPT